MRLRALLMKITLWWGASLLVVGATLASVQAEVAVIGHPGLPAADKATLAKIFTGRTVQLGGQAVRPINLKAGDSRRRAFFSAVLQQSDDDYIAYWIVRRAIGKGTPPPEETDAAAVRVFVRTTPGGIGYVDGAEVGAEDHVLLRLP